MFILCSGSSFLSCKCFERPSLLSHTIRIWILSTSLLKNAEFENLPIYIKKAPSGASFGCLISECNNPGNDGTPNNQVSSMLGSLDSFVLEPFYSNAILNFPFLSLTFSCLPCPPPHLNIFLIVTLESPHPISRT